MNHLCPVHIFHVCQRIWYVNASNVIMRLKYTQTHTHIQRIQYSVIKSIHTHTNIHTLTYKYIEPQWKSTLFSRLFFCSSQFSERLSSNHCSNAVYLRWVGASAVVTPVPVCVNISMLFVGCLRFVCVFLCVRLIFSGFAVGISAYIPNVHI